MLCFEIVDIMFQCKHNYAVSMILQIIIHIGTRAASSV